jgi:hypothetical protein
MADNDTVSVEAYNELKAQVSKLDERAKRFEGLVKDYELKFENYKGINPEEVKALKEDYDNIRKQSVKSPEDIDKLISEKENELRSSFQKQLDEARAKAESSGKELHELLVVDKALEQVGGNFALDMHAIVKEMLRREVDRDADGNLIIKGKDGKPAYSAKEPAKLKSLAEWVEDIGARHPSMLASTAKGGALNKSEQTTGVSGIDARRYIDAVNRGNKDSIPMKDRGEQATKVLSNIPFNKLL